MIFFVVGGDDEGCDYRDVYEYVDDGYEEEKCFEVNLLSWFVGWCEVSDFCSNIIC